MGRLSCSRPVADAVFDMTARNEAAKVARGRPNVAKAKQGAPKSQSLPCSASALPPSAGSVASSGNLSEVLANAAQCAECGEFDAASKLYSHASSLAPRNAQILESLGEVLMEAGRPDAASEALRKAIDFSPAAGFEKYMYLSQLLGNTMEAVEVSRSGLEVLRREKRRAGDDVARGEELAGFEVSALCGIAELLLGVIEESNDQETADRLDEDVERAISEALAVCIPESQGDVEASMALANLRLSQARRADARAAMERVVAAMRPGLDLLENENIGDAAIVKGIGMLPPLHLRLAVGKQLVEVELWADSIDVLSSILYECDFNVEVWYMLALSFHETCESDSALAALEQARATLQNPDGYVGLIADGVLEDLEARIHKKGNVGKGDKRENGKEDGVSPPDEGNTMSRGQGSIGNDDMDD